jgi:hypothetical protein
MLLPKLSSSWEVPREALDSALSASTSRRYAPVSMILETALEAN